MQRTLNILGWVGTAIVFIAVAVRLATFFGAMPEGIVTPARDKYVVWAAYTGLALVVLYTLGQWREVVAWFRQRNARYAAIASISVLVVLGLLVAVNYLSARRNKRWDLTANRQYSLSDQSIKILKGLDAPVKVRVFEKQSESDRFRTRLAEYQSQSNNKVSIDYIDPDRHPLEAKQDEVQAYGTIVLEYKGRTEKINSDNEQDFTGGLLKLLNPQQRKVYFLSGHGEKDPSTSDRGGYSGIGEALKNDQFQFDKLVLAQTNEIPADATIIAIAGPRSDLLENEVTLIKEYLDKAGKLLVLLDPPQDLKQQSPMPRLMALVKEWGVNATNSVVVDVSGRTRVATLPVAGPPYPTHAITDQFGLFTMFPLARAVTPDTANTQRAAQSFVQTSDRSWAETDFAQLQNPDTLAPETEKGDLTGPVSLAVAVTAPAANPPQPPVADAGKQQDDQKKPETRVVVIGDSDFASNEYLGVEGNRDLFVNTANWLAQQENLISIRPRDPADRRITLTDSAAKGLFWLTIVFIPLGVFGAGIFSWWRRR
jgi:ABC-type uncharacterized transport system involved in gliding motility auxiliary subunit